MVELECSDTALIPAQHARPTGLAHEDLLHLASTTRHRLGAASQAPVSPFALASELCEAMPRTRERERRLLRSVDLPTFGRLRSQTVLPKPVAHRGLATANGIRDLSDGHTTLHQRLQLLPRERSLTNVLLPVHRLQPALLHPVGDRRFVAPEPP